MPEIPTDQSIGTAINSRRNVKGIGDIFRWYDSLLDVDLSQDFHPIIDRNDLKTICKGQ